MRRNFDRGRQFQKDVLEALKIPENRKRLPVTMEDGTLVIVVPDAQSTTLGAAESGIR